MDKNLFFVPSLHSQCEHVFEEMVVSARKMCDNFCGPTICTHLPVDRFVKKVNFPQGFTLQDEQVITHFTRIAIKEQII